tara:strand:- start:384 stop:608 length:225 start_codon:yes stop_codon:yes gene_type:complete
VTGTDIIESSVMDLGDEVDMVFLFWHLALEIVVNIKSILADLVRYALIHGIGHHCSFSDTDIEALEREADAEDC